MTKYVCGFLFDKDLNLVVLIEKQNPAWQKDKWNAVGGKVEPGETTLQAMIREFNEEAGLNVESWKQYCSLRGPEFEVAFFYSVVDAETLMNVRTLTIEKLGIWSIERVSMWNFPLLPNIRWILPMALVSIKENRSEGYDIWIENPDDPEGNHATQAELNAIKKADDAEEEANERRRKLLDEELELYRQARGRAKP
jgi:8-oxo-dGTP diphosphatase